MTAKKILFRADAKPSIGTGDLLSLIQLSRHFLKRGWEAYFIIKNHKTAINLASGYDVKNIEVIDKKIKIAHEVEVINNFCQTNDISLVFFEITGRRLTDYKGLLPHMPKAAVCFDGLYPSDFKIIVNWDTDAESLFNIRNQSALYFLGPEYVILSPDFDMDRIKLRKYKTKAQNIMIAMGGADELDFTSRVVDYFIDMKPDFKINIIIGSGYPYKDSLLGKLKNSSLDYEIRSNITNMFDQYMEADIAIGAGGLTSYEIVATKTPGIVFSLYEHQRARCRYFHDKGFVKYMGFRNFDRILFAEYLNGLIGFKPSVSPFSLKTHEILEACDAVTK